MTSQATAVPVLIDFTDATWSGAQGQTSISQFYDSLEVTLGSSIGALTFNSHEAPSSGSEYDFLSLHGDGIGIGDDEIGLGEALGVTFSSAVTIQAYYFLDLFPHEGGSGESEEARVEFLTAGGIASYLDYASLVGNGAGFYAREGLSLGDVTGFALSSGFAYSDFALAGVLVDYTPAATPAAQSAVSVPEPGSLSLLGAGLLAVAFLRRGRGARRDAATV